MGVRCRVQGLCPSQRAQGVSISVSSTCLQDLGSRGTFFPQAYAKANPDITGALKFPERSFNPEVPLRLSQLGPSSVYLSVLFPLESVQECSGYSAGPAELRPHGPNSKC